MCFSSTASFATAGLTGVIGLLCLRRVKRRRELLLAAVPLIFALQQAIEGALWLILPTMPRDRLAAALTLAFLLLAQVLWPVWAPLAAGVVEPVEWRIPPVRAADGA